MADRPSACARGKESLRRFAVPEVMDRISFHPADFFAEVPAGGDWYVLKNVLHDWTYDNCVRILSVVRDAMIRTELPQPPRLLVVEHLVETDIDVGDGLGEATAGAHCLKPPAGPSPRHG